MVANFLSTMNISTVTLHILLLVVKVDSFILSKSNDRVDMIVRSAKDSSSSSSWSIGDDWSTLSSENPQNSGVDGSTIFNQDLARNAAREIGEATNIVIEATEDDIWLRDVIDEIHNEFSTLDPNTQLYDTGYSSNGFESYTKTISYLDEMGEEIAMLVRCNERPENMLVEGGRALPPLSQEEKNDVTRLVEIIPQDDAVAVEPTDFLRDAVSSMFREHARPNEFPKDEDKEVLILDRSAVAKWMTKALKTEKNARKVSSQDVRVLKTISQHCTYGTGYLSEQEFLNFYMETIVGAKYPSSCSFSATSKSDIIRRLKQRQDLVDAVWRDIRNHGILSPLEQERARIAQEIRQKYGAATALEAQQKMNEQYGDTLMDECEIMEWDHRVEQSQEISSARSQRRQASGSKSSHKVVELASDGKTPLWVRDGKFVFIDEESCIGCMQCVNVAPSSFLMLETGRARTFNQRSGSDVEQAVASCPVSCMHPVSFRELKEYETARDEGDGRTDHRHLGKGHIPLYVAGIDSDMNRRSSWYHTLKHRCLVSSQCPQKGCYICPKFQNPGDNPYFKAQHRQAEHARATHFIDNGDADVWSKSVEL